MQSRWMLEEQYPDLRACASNAQVCDTGGSEKLQGKISAAGCVRLHRGLISRSLAGRFKVLPKSIRRVIPSGLRSELR
jgi:hypothetical protein